MRGKFTHAFGLLASNLSLFSQIVLTVWLPGNALVGYLELFAYEPGSMRPMQFNAAIGLLLGPLYSGAVAFALSERWQGRSVTYTQALRAGIRNWGVLLLAWLGAGLFISLGLLALIIPGIVLIVRYSLIDYVVVLDNPGSTVAWKRSNELTKGLRWPIAAASLVFFVVFGLLALIAHSALAALSESDTIGRVGEWVLNVVVDCAGDVLFVWFSAILYLFYREAKVGAAESTQKG